MSFFSMLQASAESLDSCLFWNRWYLPFSFSGVGLLMHFHLRLCFTGKKAIPAILAGYVPPLYFLFHVLTGNYYIGDFVKGPWGWYPLAFASGSIAALNASVFIAFEAIELYLAYRFGKTGRLRRIKRQAAILAASNFAAFLASSVVHGAVLGRDLPVPLMPFMTMLVWIAGIWFALYRYNFLGYSLSLASPQIISRVNELLIFADRDFTVLEVNKRLAALAGSAAESFRGKKVETLFGGSEIVALLQDLVGNRSPYCRGESLLAIASGPPIPVLVQVSAIANTLGEAEGIVLIAEDIRPLKRLETLNENNKALLEEKRIILAEVHHRIKNNMNTIYGLLVLQARSLEGQPAAVALQDAGRRVQSMMLLYDKLYRSSSYTELPASAFLSPLIDEIVSNFRIGNTGIEVEKDIGDFVLDAKVLQPLGILVNELVTNSMKYAFAGIEGGRISVVARLDGGFVTLSVADNGVGMDESVDFDRSGGFGLELVKGLALQVGGTVSLDRSAGTKITVQFKRMD